MASPFNRNTPKPGTSPKQVAMVLTLLALLGGVLAYNSMSSGPRSAGASSFAPALPDGPMGGPLSAQATAEEIAKLANDPTARLLRETRRIGSDLDDPPANPFGVSPKWLSSLVRPEAPKVAPKIVENLHPVAVPPPPVAALTNLDSLKVQGIFKDGGRTYAIVNGSMVGAGAVIAGVRIVEVRDDRLICQSAAQPDGPKLEIAIQRPK